MTPPKLGRYEIVDEIGKGAMGVVYLARDPLIGRLVALKTFRIGYSVRDQELEQFRIRFMREAQSAGILSHPNIVTIHDVVEQTEEGLAFIAMEYVRGTTLKALLQSDQPMSLAFIVDLVAQIAEALDYAHAHRVIHRDVKPANILITADNKAKITDFGIARLDTSNLTQEGQLLGTPNYMAPEQTVGGSTIDARTDVYAVGVVLFEMICGQRPFQAEDTLALLGMHRAAPIPKVADRVDHTVTLPPGTQDLIDTAMAKAPEDRFQSAVELAAAIDAITNVQKTPPPGSIKISPSTRRSAVIATAPTMHDLKSDRFEKVKRPSSRFPIFLVLLVLGGGVAAAWYINNRKPEKTDTHADGSGRAPLATTTTPDAAKAVTPPPPAVDAGVAAAVIDAPTVVVMDPEADAAELVITNPVDLNEEEPVPSPEEAANPAPADPNKPEPEDEAEDAPKSEQEAESHVEKKVAETPKDKPQPQLATTIRDAVKLIQANQDDLALASLLKIWKKAPKSAYVPFLLGNLYFDKRWWSVAMDHYKIAIAKNAGYKKNPTLIRNIIRTLGSVKTNKRAQAFLKFTIGRAALPYLRQAAQHEKNPHIKKWAAYMAKVIR